MQLSDMDAILAFLAENFPDNPRQSNRKFWMWHYVDHPNSHPGEIPIWIAKSNERIAGQLATIPVELNVGSTTVPAIWILDLMVDPEFRRRGIMKRLVLEAQKQFPFMLATASTRQHSAAMFKGLGWTVFSRVPRYHRPLFPGHAVKEISRLAPVRAFANIIFAPFRPSKGQMARASTQVRPVTKFDSQFDDLAEQCRRRSPCSIRHSATYLKWQFEDQPLKKYEVLGYYEGNQLKGYVTVFFRRASAGGFIDKAAISDICYHPDFASKVVDILILAALDLAVARRAGGLVTDVMDALLEDRLKYFGFWPIKSEIEIMAIGPEGNDIMYDPSNWYLTRGDSDISIFEDPNL